MNDIRIVATMITIDDSLLLLFALATSIGVMRLPRGRCITQLSKMSIDP